ncbi:MAG: alkaline phosphatase family protein, partial [Polyangiales bacterium]
ALVISPFAARTGVDHTTFDHTSILQMIAERFGPTPASYSPSVDARRAAGIASVSSVLGTSARPAIPPAPSAPAVPPTPVPVLRAPKTDAQQGFVTAIESFAQSQGPAASTKYPEIAHWLANKP